MELRHIILSDNIILLSAIHARFIYSHMQLSTDNQSFNNYKIIYIQYTIFVIYTG